MEVELTPMVVEVLLGVGGFDVGRGAEMTMVNMDIDVQQSDMGGGKNSTVTKRPWSLYV